MLNRTKARKKLAATVTTAADHELSQTLALIKNITPEEFAQLKMLNHYIENVPLPERNHLMETLSNSSLYPSTIRRAIEAARTLLPQARNTDELIRRLNGAAIDTALRANLRVLLTYHAHLHEQSAILSKWIAATTACVNPLAHPEPLLTQVVESTFDHHHALINLTTTQIELVVRISLYQQECNAFKRQLKAKMKDLISQHQICREGSSSLLASLTAETYDLIINQFLTTTGTTQPSDRKNNLERFYEQNKTFRILTQQYRIISRAQATLGTPDGIELRHHLEYQLADKIRQFDQVLHDPANTVTLKRSPEGTDFLDKVKRTIARFTFGLFYKDAIREHHARLFTRNLEAITHHKQTKNYKESVRQAPQLGSDSVWHDLNASRPRRRSH